MQELMLSPARAATVSPSTHVEAPLPRTTRVDTQLDTTERQEHDPSTVRRLLASIPALPQQLSSRVASTPSPTSWAFDATMYGTMALQYVWNRRNTQVSRVLNDEPELLASLVIQQCVGKGLTTQQCVEIANVLKDTGIDIPAGLRLWDEYNAPVEDSLREKALAAVRDTHAVRCLQKAGDDVEDMLTALDDVLRALGKAPQDGYWRHMLEVPKPTVTVGDENV